MTDVRDQWAAGASYEDFMGRWSRRLAPVFVSWLRVPARVHWLDVGCGTGALTDAICTVAEPASVVGCDPAAPLVEFAREHSRDDRQSFVVAGAGNLPHRPNGFGCVASLLALNFLPNAEIAVRDMRAVATGGGTIGACVWDYADGMLWLRRFWDAAVAIDPGAQAFDEGRRFPVCRPDVLTAVFNSAGLVDVCCEPLSISTVFDTFEDYWRPFLGGTGPAPSYVASLDAAHRAALQRQLVETLVAGPAGAISLTARAWAVRGTVARAAAHPV